MEEIKRIDKSLSETLRKSDLQGVSVDITELILDSLLEESILKELPIVGSVLGIGKTVVTVKNQLFLKKILAFLSGVKDVPQEKRLRMIDQVNDSNKFRIKVGEKLVYILDKCDDYIDAKYISQLFAAFLKEEIEYQDFLKGSRIIQDLFVGDLEYFLENEPSIFSRELYLEEAPNEDELPLINAGILQSSINPINVQDQTDHRADSKYEVSGGEVTIWITTIGDILKRVLKKEEF